MAFSELLKIKPQLDSNDLASMERNLQTRFTRVAKRFGQGLKSAMSMAAKGTIIFAVVDKIMSLLNPLQEMRDIAREFLGKADDLATFAEQFGTTADKLARLQTFARATGIDSDSLREMMIKFQSSLAEAKVEIADPAIKEIERKNPTRNFVNESDTAEAFFKFVQSLQKMKPDDRILIQEQVFGARATGKMADFLMTDMAKLAVKLNLPKADISEAINSDASLNDDLDAMIARQEFVDLPAKAGRVNKQTVNDLAEANAKKLKEENNALSRMKTFETIAQGLGKVTEKIDQMFTWATQTAGPAITEGFKKAEEMFFRLEGFFSDAKTTVTKWLGWVEKYWNPINRIADKLKGKS